MPITITKAIITDGVTITGTAVSVGNITSTASPTITNSVTIGTTNGSPFSTPVNSYQFATQPASAPYNYITVPGSAGLAFGTGDFTVEWFQYQTVNAAAPRIFWYTNTVNATYPSFGLSVESSLYLWSSPSTLFNAGTRGTVLNTWVHYAAVRISSKIIVYRNGVRITGASNDFAANISDSTSNFYIGSKSSGGLQSEQFSGSITSFRVCKGLGVYTGNFTTPTAPLGQTQVENPYGGSNTKAITNQCTLLLNP